MFAIFVASGLCITYLLLPPAPEPADKPHPPPVLRVAQMPVPAQGDLLANALDLVRRYASGEIGLKLPDGTVRKVRRGTFGAEIDRVRLADFIKETLRPTSAVRLAHEEGKHAGEPIDVPLPVTLDAEIAIARLLDLKSEIDRPALSAFVDLETRKVKPETVGIRLDVYGTLARLDAALRRGEETVEASVETITPALRASELGDLRFDHVLGYFETRYSRGEKSKDRTYNLRLAASKLDGTVVMPGQIFDFNGTVGPRDEAHGYRVAPVIAEGELVDGLGGGTCQISGTLHGAAFFAGLEIVERYPHSRPSYYIKLGLDATVVYPTINFRLRNNFDFPIVLHETVAGGVVRAEILGPPRKLTVTYFRRIDEILPFEEVERKTPRLPEGVRVLAQRGIPGFKTLSSRLVRDGAYGLREKWTDSYPPTTQIVNVGEGPKNPDYKGHDDNHPEYLVDEYLVVTQGPDIRTPGVSEKEPGGGTVESRVPGKTGERGYTERMGMGRFRVKGEGEEANEEQQEGAPLKKTSASENKDDKGEKAKDDSASKKKKRRKKKKKDEG